MDPQQPKLRLQDRRRRLAWVKVAAGTAVVAICLILVFYVSHLPSITISEIEVSGTNGANADAVRSVIAKKLAGSYAYLIPHANAFVFPTVTLQKAIMNALPQVARVSLATKNLTTLDVSITERSPAAVWCEGTPAGEISADPSIVDVSPEPAGDCFLMDSDGIIFANATSTDTFLHYYGLLSGSPIASTFLGGAFASLHGTVLNVSDAISRTPGEILISNNNQDASVSFAEGGVVRFARATDRQLTLENVASVFASQSFKQNKNFEYVDFRFGDKVYVKFK